MAALVEEVWIKNEMAVIQLQEAELQAQQDALVAQRLAIAFSLGCDLENEQSLETAIQQLDLGIPEDISQLEGQLQELRAAGGLLLAESLQESFSKQAQVDREFEAAAAALQAQELWHDRIARHDATFARKLASLPENQWLEFGDNLKEPLDLPMPAAALGAEAESPGSGATPRQQQQRQPLKHATTPTTAPNPAAGTTSPPATIRPTPSSAPSSGSTGPIRASGGGPGPSSAGAGGHVAQPAAGPSTCGTVECLCCFDRFAGHEVTCAGADTASSSTASAGCGHYFCSGCITEYVRGAVQEGKYPISCPMATGGGGGGGGGDNGRGGQQRQGCRLKFSREAVLEVLHGNPKELQAFRLLEAKSALDPSKLLYCPHKACSSPLLLEPNELAPDQPTTCPACKKGFCPRCRIPGWHKGYTCAQFQSLPAHLRSAEDAAMLQLSARQQWKQCPQCQQMVERSEGCNHMLCRCGNNFCYGCGKQYTDTRPTAQNVHGTPACGCPLFDVPADQDAGAADEHDDSDSEDQDEDEVRPVRPVFAPQAAGPVGLHIGPGPGAAPLRPRPWRGGRLVSHTRCRHSASIYDCPQGPGRCWFWHAEDDEVL